MRVVRQLLREFWLPLVFGIAWTAFNFIDRPFPQWTVREVVNVLGPTFFFASWLIAQWYRVRKQQYVEDGLTKIQQDVRAIQSPLLPCAVFVTLEYNATDKDLAAVFEDEPGFREFGTDKSMPPPPIGLPPGVSDGRVIHPNGYIEYHGNIIAAAGISRLDHPGFNLIHRDVRHTVASLSRETLTESQKRHHVLLQTPRLRTEIYFSGRPKKPEVPPSLILCTRSSPPDTLTMSARALDNNVFVDHVLKLFPEGAEEAQGWSTSALKGAYIRIVVSLFYIEPVLSLPRESWPVLRNLQFWLGPGAAKVLSFSSEQLQRQVLRENPDPIVRGQGRSVQILFEIEVDETTYSKRIFAGR